MALELTCTNGRFCIDNLRLSEITDLFTITSIKEDYFSCTDGESIISLSIRDDDSIEMRINFNGRLFYGKGHRFAIHSFATFDLVYLYDESSEVVFSVSINKE